MIPIRDHNPTRIAPVVTVSIIAVCFLLYLFQLTMTTLDLWMLQHRFGMIPAALSRYILLRPEINPLPPEITVLTSQFLHSGTVHLLINMWFLWVFGDNVEDSMGHARFIVFYLLCGAFAALMQTLATPTAIAPLIGASGAISGVLGAYLLLYPYAPVVTLVPVVIIPQIMKIPAFVVLSFWFMMQLFYSIYYFLAGESTTAWYAHAGGFLAGMVLIKLFKYRDQPMHSPITIFFRAKR